MASIAKNMVNLWLPWFNNSNHCLWIYKIIVNFRNGCVVVCPEPIIKRYDYLSDKLAYYWIIMMFFSSYTVFWVMTDDHWAATAELSKQRQNYNSLCIYRWIWPALEVFNRFVSLLHLCASTPSSNLSHWLLWSKLLALIVTTKQFMIY